ncbi:YCII-like protein [Ilyonectria robusta]
MFEKHPVDGEPALFKGSVIVYTGDSAEEVHKLITNDAYARGGVWDLEKAQIIPVITFYALPLPYSQVY